MKKDITYILTSNNKRIRAAIEKAGIYVCPCASFENAVWLKYSTVVGNGVHGTGYYDDEVGTKTVQEELSRFVHECKCPYFCLSVHEFINKIKEFENGKGTKTE